MTKRGRILTAALAFSVSLASVIVLSLAPTTARADVAADIAFEPLITGRSFITNAAWAPDGRLFFLEKDAGDVMIARDGAVRTAPFFHVDVVSDSEQGLLGLAIPPTFAQDPWIYLYYGDPNTLTNRIIRVRADGDRAGETQPVFDLLTTENGYHNGGDITFGPDGMLYVAVGEVHESARAQRLDDLGGRILRLSPDGSVPPDNPFGPTNPTYSLGHRNSFGLCFDPAGDFWETENGPEAFDEVNKIVAGQNYGWPIELGPGGNGNYTEPVLWFKQIIVPTGCVARDGILWFGDFSGQLYRYDGAGAAQIVATLPFPITDLEMSPEGNLAAVTTEGIFIANAHLFSPTDSPDPRLSAAIRKSPRRSLWTIGLAVLVVAIALFILVSVARRRRGRGD